MALRSTSDSTGLFVITKLRLFAATSLILTWWIASLLPHYQPMIKAEFKSRIEDARQKIPSIKVDWTPTLDPRAAYNASKVAMMIEPRVMPHLVPQLLHMIAVVPPDWRFLFIGSPESATMMSRSIPVKHQQVIGKLDLMVLPEPWDISSKELVYRTLTDKRFYDEFLPGVEWLLKYEYDSILCANSEQSLDEWLDWHWAGAPRTLDDRFSGNGGLSLRRISAIKKILNFQARYNDSAPEDEWFGKRLYITPGLKVASGLEGALAVESVYMEKPMGYHVQGMGENLPAEVWGDYERRKSMLKYCPELYTVLNAKLDRERCPGDTKDGVIHPTPEEKAAEKAKQEAEEEAKRKAQAAQLQAQEEAKKKAEEEAKKKAEEEEKKKKAEEEKKKKADEKAKADKATGSPASETTEAAKAPTTSADEGKKTKADDKKDQSQEKDAKKEKPKEKAVKADKADEGKKKAGQDKPVSSDSSAKPEGGI